MATYTLPTDSLVWAERSVSLSDLMQETSLPVVVQMKQKGAAGENRGQVPSIIHQPLLLYREMKGYKIVARNVSSLESVPTRKGGVQYREGGSVIVIPADYQGWFRNLDDNSVPVLNVANLARIMPNLFLSAKKFPCFSLLNPLKKKDYMYEKLFFPPGLYKVTSVFEDYVKYKAEKVGTKRKLLRCLVCESTDHIDVLVPFDVTGEFYVVENKKTKPTRGDTDARAYTLKQLLSMDVFTKPVAIETASRRAAEQTLCGFTGIIKVVDIIEDWTVIASTLDGSRKLIELPVAPFPEFRQALNGKDLIESGALRPEYLYVHEGAADKYAKEIKVRERIPVQQEEEKKRRASPMRESQRATKSRELKPVRGTPRSPKK